MKKRIIIAIILAIGLSSCSSFLEEHPTDRLTTVNFYQSTKDAQAAVDATYQQMNSIYNRLMYNLCDLPCDGMKNGLGMPNAFLQDLAYMRHDQGNTFVRDMWNNCYSGIAKANAAIENIPAVKMEENLKNRFLGEAKFLRALYYFNLVRFFGDVPLVTKLGLEEAIGPRTSKDVVYELIIEDLSFAENALPMRSTYTTANKARASKEAAKCLLGKVYLTRGDFEKAKNKLAEVVDNEGQYGLGLHDDYAANWNTATEAGKEAILYLEYGVAPFTNNGEMSLAGPKYSVPGGSIEVANSNEADIPTQELYDSYNANDKRRDFNLRFEFTNYATKEVVRSSIPLFGKFWIENISTCANCDINMHVMRYADAILMYAEALSETGDAQKALTVLNRIRERAFGNSSGNYSLMSKEEFRNAILNERYWEFPIEGHRWFDLVRMGKLKERMLAHAAYEASVAEANKTDIIKNYKDCMTLMPVPQSQLDLNKELTQNPGW
jgi:tetratricopeptide (TPR) repeat protein